MPLALVLIAAKCVPGVTYVQKPTTHAHHRRKTTSSFVRAQRSTYRDVQERLASLKQAVKHDIEIHEQSQQNGDPLNPLDDSVSHDEILKSARELREVCDEALQNTKMLKVVSGSKRNIRRYRDYADEVIARFGGTSP
ncbi:MAG TPA: hypothetical protein VGJ82_05410 [Thermoanaerobaculia bacterium]